MNSKSVLTCKRVVTVNILFSSNAIFMAFLKAVIKLSLQSSGWGYMIWNEALKCMELSPSAALYDPLEFLSCDNVSRI